MSSTDIGPTDNLNAFLWPVVLSFFESKEGKKKYENNASFFFKIIMKKGTITKARETTQ